MDYLANQVDYYTKQLTVVHARVVLKNGIFKIVHMSFVKVADGCYDVGLGMCSYYGCRFEVANYGRLNFIV